MPPTNTWLRLRDYKWGELIAERPSPTPSLEGGRYRLHITANGRALYEREWARYREIYAEVDAPDPVPLRLPGNARERRDNQPGRC